MSNDDLRDLARSTAAALFLITIALGSVFATKVGDNIALAVCL